VRTRSCLETHAQALGGELELAAESLRVRL
jgi:hypothetical protein